MNLRSLLIALPLAGLLSGSALAEEAQVTVLHTTDLHGALTAYDYLADRPASRGLTKLATLVRAAQAEGPTLLLDAGDCIQGRAIEIAYARGSRSAPEPMMTAMSRLGYDALAVGNHEFDDGLERLQDARAAASFPFLSANILRDADGAFAFEPAIVKTIGNVRVGIIGITTPAVASMVDASLIQGLRFVSPVEAARREVKRLRGQENCDLVVILAHTGLERDPRDGSEVPPSVPDENWGYRLAADVLEVDAVIMGHTHMQIASAEVNGVLVAQAGQAGEALGRIDFTLTRESDDQPWQVTQRTGRVDAVGDDTEADPDLTAFSEPYHRAAQEWLDEVIGEAATDLSAPRSRYSDNPLWGLLHRAQLDASKADVSLAALNDPDFTIKRGPITVRDALRLYSHANTLDVIELTGAELHATLEHSARYFETYTYEHDRRLAAPRMPGFNFDSAAGVEYEIDLTQPAGERIVHLTYRGRPLDPSAKLEVAVNSYRSNGGGGFAAVRDAPKRMQLSTLVRDMLIRTIRDASPLSDSDFEAGWRVLPEYATHPERPLIDLLVRQNVAPRSEVHRLGGAEPAAAGDLAFWIGRAFDWRESRKARTSRGLPDSLRPWFEGLQSRGVLEGLMSNGRFDPFAKLTAAQVLDVCERVAREAHYAIDATPDASFRRSLLTGIRDADDQLLDPTSSESLTRADLIGIVANLRFPTLRFLETTDFHGAIIQTRTLRDGRVFGSTPYFASYLRSLRAENPEGIVLLSGGDCFQGTMISNLTYGKTVVEQMNALEYTAMAIGNHEFDWSADTLARRVEEMQFSALGANIRERASGARPYWAGADTVVNRRGVRVGILGLAYRNTPDVTLKKHIEHLVFEDDSVTAARSVPGLRGRSDVVVAVGHIPAQSGRNMEAVSGDLVRLAKGVPGVAAWFGGHSHNRVADRVDGIPVLIAGSRGYNVAVCDLVVDPLTDQVVESHIDHITTFHDQAEPDAEFVEHVERWNAAIEPIAAEQVGSNTRRLTRGGPEATVGNLVADAMRAAVDADVALQNSGGLRADLAAGTVTKGMVYGVMPFDNVIVTMELTGTQIRLALEGSLNRNRVTQVSGIRYTYDTSRPKDDRILALTDTDGKPIDPAKRYVVAINDFMATGSNTVLQEGFNTETRSVLVRDAIENYVREQSRNGGSLDIDRDGRIERTGG